MTDDDDGRRVSGCDVLTCAFEQSNYTRVKIPNKTTLMNYLRKVHRHFHALTQCNPTFFSDLTSTSRRIACT